MAMDREERHLLSAAFFCPQSRAPDEEYLAGLHSFLRQNQYGQILLQEILDLESIWTIFENARDDVRALSQGPVYIDILRGWAANGESHRLSEVRSGIVALPLLIILQIGQYLRYLEFQGLAHQEFLAEIRHAGGTQGYCGGLPPAIALACARDETEVVKNAGIAMRILLGIGAYGEAADEGNGTGTTTLALRLKYEGQGDEFARLFPGVCTNKNSNEKNDNINFACVSRLTFQLLQTQNLLAWSARLRSSKKCSTMPVDKGFRFRKWTSGERCIIQKIRILR